MGAQGILAERVRALRIFDTSKYLCPTQSCQHSLGGRIAGASCHILTASLVLSLLAPVS